MYAENETVVKMNEAFLNFLPGELYVTEINDKTPDNVKYPLGLFKLLRINRKQNRRFSKITKAYNCCKINAKLIQTWPIRKY